MATSHHKYQRVSTRIWTDAWNEDERTLVLYLLTNPHRITEGLYRLPKAYIMGDLGWSAERLAEPFAGVLRSGFIEYDEAAQVVFMTEALLYDQPPNENCMKAAARQLRELPDTPLFAALMQAAERYAERFAQRLPALLPERFGNSPSPSPTPAPQERSEVPKRGTSLSSTASAADATDDPYADGFEVFYTAYPRHEHRRLAHDRWGRLSDSDRRRATDIAGVMRALRDRGLCPKKCYIPLPDTFLAGKRWEDWRDGPLVEWGRDALDPGDPGDARILAGIAAVFQEGDT